MAVKQLPINTDTLLILEKGFESGEGQRQAIENLNVIEQLLVGIVGELNENYPAFQANFIVRRLPTYTIPYFNKNEYAIILENLDFTLSTPNASVSDSASIDGKPIKINLGHTEIYRRDTSDESEAETPSATVEGKKGGSLNGSMNNGRAYGSHEIFQRFSSAFVKSFGVEIEREVARPERDDVDQVQLIGPHLLHSVKTNSEVTKIFKLTQSEVVLSLKKKSRCKLQVNHESSLLVIELEGTEAIIRPALFLQNGYPKIHISILERIPLHHPTILNIGESLLKGCFLMPTSYETLWTIQFWPSESHIIFGFHPASIIGRIFKLYGSFCLNPINFWENLNSCFLIGVEDTESLRQNLGMQALSIDFVMSTFIQELEELPETTDWEPKNFSTRFTDLLTQVIQAFDKGFHAHYYTKRNVLRNLWRGQQFGELDDDNNGLEHVDSIRSTSVPPEDLYETQGEDEFGLHLEELSLDERDEKAKFGPPRRKSTVDSTCSKEETPKQSRSLSKYLGNTILRRLSMGTVPGFNDRKASTLKAKTNRSMTDIAAGFEEIVNQQRRDQIRRRRSSPEEIELDDVFSSSVAFADTSCSVNPNRPGTSRGITNDACEAKDSIYTTIFQLLNEISPSNYLSNKELITHLDNCRRELGSQGELIAAWTQVINEIPKPKHVCPHTFSPRQIQSISIILQTLSKCTTAKGNDVPTKGRLPAWEIIGDILRIALYQMRSDGEGGRRKQESLKVKRKRSAFSFKGLRTSASFSGGPTVKPTVAKSNSSRVSKFSFRHGSYDVCKYHTDVQNLDPETETALAMEDPETAATHRLLQWLWQLRNSEIGRLSRRAQKFMESLYHSSLIQSHFLEQLTELRVFESMAIRSAVAVSRIMADRKYPTHVPLTTASKRGWQWSDMVLSFASWNEDKGNTMKAKIPLINSSGYVTREIRIRPMASAGPFGGQQTLKRIHNSTEPDTEALNLAFHSELATPLGMYDFEEPLCPGPYTAPILIFTSLGYFSHWEVAPGNIIHALVRLQKFIVLQHIATMLLPPHRKTAINEVRKLSKSLAFTAFQFEDNVMTKTFRRLASLRHTRRLFSSSSCKENTYSCDEVNCQNPIEGDSKVTQYKGKLVECTKL